MGRPDLLFVLVYVTRSLLRALAIAQAVAWTGSAASVKVKPRSLAIFRAAAVGQLALVAGVGAVRHQSTIGGILALIVLLLLLGLAGLWLIVSLQLPHANAHWRDMVPGSLFYGIVHRADLEPVEILRAFDSRRLHHR